MFFLIFTYLEPTKSTSPAQTAIIGNSRDGDRLGSMNTSWRRESEDWFGNPLIVSVCDCCGDLHHSLLVMRTDFQKPFVICASFAVAGLLSACVILQPWLAL